MMTRRQKRKRQVQTRTALLIAVVVVLLTLTFIVRHSKEYSGVLSKGNIIENRLKYTVMPQLDVELLTVNEYSRPGDALSKVNGIVVHYTANPGTTARQNRDYFEGLKDTKITKASAHFIIGIDGEIVQCIPTAEIAYASNERNADTIAIECCHPDETGKFSYKTYESLIKLTAYLIGKFDLTTDDVIRHYDVTGKNCPKYYVESESAWQTLKESIRTFIKEHGDDVGDKK